MYIFIQNAFTNRANGTGNNSQRPHGNYFQQPNRDQSKGNAITGSSFFAGEHHYPTRSRRTDSEFPFRRLTRLYPFRRHAPPHTASLYSQMRIKQPPRTSHNLVSNFLNKYIEENSAFILPRETYPKTGNSLVYLHSRTICCHP